MTDTHSSTIIQSQSYLIARFEWPASRRLVLGKSLRVGGQAVAI